MSQSSPVAPAPSNWVQDKCAFTNTKITTAIDITGTTTIISGTSLVYTEICAVMLISVQHTNGLDRRRHHHLNAV